MKLFLLVIWIITALLSCSKGEELSIPKTKCIEIYTLITSYDDSWNISNQFIGWEGKTCDEQEISYFRGIVSKQADKGYWVCPPEKRFEKWYIK